MVELTKKSCYQTVRRSNDRVWRSDGALVLSNRLRGMVELKGLITTLRLQDPILVPSTRSKEEIRVNKEKVCHDTEAMPSTIQYIGLPDFPPRFS